MGRIIHRRDTRKTAPVLSASSAALPFPCCAIRCCRILAPAEDGCCPVKAGLSHRIRQVCSPHQFLDLHDFFDSDTAGHGTVNILAGFQCPDNHTAVKGTLRKDTDSIDPIVFQCFIKAFNDRDFKLLCFCPIFLFITDIDLSHRGMCFKKRYKKPAETSAANQRNINLLPHYLTPF